MRYELIKDSANDLNNPIETILNNRGIKDAQSYLLLNDSDKTSYKNLDYIAEAVKMFDEHFTAEHPIGILKDNDFDGVASAAIIYKFIKGLDESYDVRLYVHEKNKSHGLSDKDFELDDDVKLLIVPDAGSNDIEEHTILKENGVDCICLDHHQIVEDITQSPAIIVNNQSSKNYSNKNCCGASIALEFCMALEEFYWVDICRHLIDLAATANIADVMDISSFETRAIINEGINSLNNKMLLEIIKAQDFSMKGRVNPHTVAFYVAPLVNAFIRLGTQKERLLLLKAFCEIEDETFEYTKRGTSTPIQENIYEHCVRLAKSYKGKQDRSRDKAFKLLMDKIDPNNDNKIEIINGTKEIDKSLTGLVAIKISEAINKPVLLVKQLSDGTLSGSGRTFDNCPVNDFRGLTEQCPGNIFSQGHPSAFGVGIDADKVDEATEWFNEQLKDVSMDKVYYADFVVDVDLLDVGFIQTIDQHQHVWGHGVSEPVVVVENIRIMRDDVHIQGKNFDSIAFMINDIKYVIFKLPGDDPLLNWASDWNGDEWDELVMNAVVEVSLNEYQGVYTPQCIIKDYNIMEG